MEQRMRCSRCKHKILLSIEGVDRVHKFDIEWVCPNCSKINTDWNTYNAHDVVGERK